MTAPSATVLVERPPPGLARGREAAPAWLIAALGLTALALVLVFYVRKLRSRRKA